MRWPSASVGTLCNMARRIIIFLTAGLLAGAILSAQSSGARSVRWVGVEAPAVDAGRLIRRFPRGSKLVLVGSGGKRDRTVLNLPFFAVRDPEVSFDGKQILFSAQRKADSRWQVWTLKADGTGLRQLTHGRDNCLHPLYLAEGAIAYTGESVRGRAQIYVRTASAATQPITFGPGDFRLEDVLHDGRLLVSAGWPLRAPGLVQRSRQLYVLHPDGSGLRVLRDVTHTGTRNTEAAEIAAGTLVFRGQQPGRAATLWELRAGAVRALPLGIETGSLYWPRPFENGWVVASQRRGSRYLPVMFHPRTHRVRPLLRGDGVAGSLVEVVRLQAHAAPLVYPSILQWLNLPLYRMGEGQLLCLNSRLSMNPRAVAAAAVRVRILGRSSHGSETLGTAPVASDGSFYVQVAADRAIRFQLLDAADRVLREQRSWIWVRPDEQHACTGCHESEALAPPNRWPLILRRKRIPYVIGGPAATAAGAPAARTQGGGKRTGVPRRSKTGASRRTVSMLKPAAQRGTRKQCSVTLCRRMPPMPPGSGASPVQGAEQ